MDEDARKYFQRHWAKFIQFDETLALPSADGKDPKANKNPMIPIEQFRAQLRNLRGSLNLTERQINVLAAAADENHDGYITLEEFQHLITSSDAQDSQVKRILYALADPVVTKKQSIAVHAQIDESRKCIFPFFILLVSLAEFDSRLFAPYQLSKGLFGLCFLGLGNLPPYSPMMLNIRINFLNYVMAHGFMEKLYYRWIYGLSNGFYTIKTIGTFFALYPMTDENEYCTSLPSCCSGCMSFSNSSEPGPLVFLPAKRWQLWRYLSCAFMHHGLAHLFGNVIPQLVIGISLEVAHGSGRLAILYFSAVAVGCMLQYAVDPSEFLVGASGGVYGLMTAHLANVFLNWSEMPRKWFRLLLAGGYVLQDFSSAFKKMSSCEFSNVSVAGHLGGAFVGLFVGVVVLYNIKVKRYELIIRKICIGIFSCVLFVLVIVNIFKSSDSLNMVPRIFNCSYPTDDDEDDVFSNKTIHIVLSEEKE